MYNAYVHMFKGCVPKILLGPFLNTVPRMSVRF